MSAHRFGMNISTATWVTRWMVAAIFVAAAPQKILAPADFALSVAGYAILPDVLVNVTALALPWLEMIVAILLLCRVWTGPAFFLANAMFVVFLGALASAYLRGLDIDCGCFSSSPSTAANMIWYMTRDVIFLLIGLAAAWLDRKDHMASAHPAIPPSSSHELN